MIWGGASFPYDGHATRVGGRRTVGTSDCGRRAASPPLTKATGRESAGRSAAGASPGLQHRAMRRGGGAPGRVPPRQRPWACDEDRREARRRKATPRPVKATAVR